MIRAATADDADGIAAIAAAYDLQGLDSAQSAPYRELVSKHGRLAVADVDGEVVGFGGIVDVHGVAMLTDLFLQPEHHGRGLGTALLAFLMAGYERRMTFSSSHPAALAAYRRAGMERHGTLLYLRGPVARSSTGISARRVSPQEFATDRPELLELYGGRATLLHLLDGPDLVGHAIVVENEAGPSIHRLVTTAKHTDAAAAVVAALDRDAVVDACVPDWSPAAGRLLAGGFEVTDRDPWMASDPFLLPPTLVVINPGLA